MTRIFLPGGLVPKDRIIEMLVSDGPSGIIQHACRLAESPSTSEPLAAPQGFVLIRAGAAVPQDFYLGAREVTRAEFEAVMGPQSAPTQPDPQTPVVSVTWRQALEYCEKLTQRDGAYRYMLPSEAQWEYACRAGTAGDTYGPLPQIAHYEIDDPAAGPFPVGGKTPNPWGLYDMIGNVEEWCLIDGNGPPSSSNVVLRGGSYFSGRSKCTASSRTTDYCQGPGFVSGQAGFRVAAVKK